MVAVGITFISLTIIEFFTKRERYKLSDAFTNTLFGLQERSVSKIMEFMVFLNLATLIHREFGLFEIQNSWVNYVLLFFLIDFVYYWHHRLCHETSVFWGAHIVHHQSEEYNFAVGFRISWIQSIERQLFWLIFPLIGFTPEAVVGVFFIIGSYQFFLHTKAKVNLGPFSKIFMVPAHHRVHHGSNEKYIDKNYGGALIIWDRIFGTFEPETEEVTYGVADKNNNLSMWESTICFYRQLFFVLPKEKGFMNKIKLLFSAPINVKKKAEMLGAKFSDEMAEVVPEASKGVIFYLAFQFTCILMGTIMITGSDFASYELGYACLGVFIAITCYCVSSVLNHKKNLYRVEIPRLLLCLVMSYVLFVHLPEHFYMLIAYCVISLGIIMFKIEK